MSDNAKLAVVSGRVPVALKRRLDTFSDVSGVRKERILADALRLYFESLKRDEAADLKHTSVGCRP